MRIDQVHEQPGQDQRGDHLQQVRHRQGFARLDHPGQRGDDGDQNDGRRQQQKDAPAIIARATPPQIFGLILQEQRNTGRDEAKSGDVEAKDHGFFGFHIGEGTGYAAKKQRQEQKEPGVGNIP